MRTPTPQAFLVAAAALGGAGLTALFGFGPLDPPNGPITSTYKTLLEVEPRTAISATNTPGDADSKFKITKPGSYYLTGNITGVSGKSGIEVTVNCTIDLGGFELTGVNGSLDGIRLVGAVRATVRNGRLANWGGNGIAGDQCRAGCFEDLCVESNGAAGIAVGQDSSLSRVHAFDNTTNGIQVASSCTIVDCVASGNKLSGIGAGSFSAVSRCITHDNLEHGISSLDGGSISDCVSQGNASAGIRTGGGIVRGNVCEVNAYANIFVTGNGGALVTDNRSRNAGQFGIYCKSGLNRVAGNLLVVDAVAVRAELHGWNLIVGNRSVGSDYDIGGDNDFGQVIVSPGVEFSSSNPWANFYID